MTNNDSAALDTTVPSIKKRPKKLWRKAKWSSKLLEKLEIGPFIVGKPNR